MASFRTGFKIFGEISVKQGLGRIRSFSEDRKPGQWLPEDQWAVRQPGSTCPEPSDKPKKRAKSSKSWLSLCKDPESDEKQLQCDIRHNNCPPPPVKEDGPWYSLDNLIPKKKQEKPPPPIQCCKEEMKRRESSEDEEVCENMVDKTQSFDKKPEPPETSMPKQEPCPAPVVNISCPLPKELNLMLWCGRPSRDTSRIASACQSDKLPFEEFRPQTTWKPPPFSLPKTDLKSNSSSSCNIGSIPFSEFKQVEVPKPLYTRYKSVELRDSNFLLNMVDAKCPGDEKEQTNKAIRTLPNPDIPKCVETNKDKDKQTCPEKPIISIGSVKPVRLKNAPKFEFRPKPTKLIEKCIPKNPFAKSKTDLTRRPPEEDKSEKSKPDEVPAKTDPDQESPKVITGNLTNEPQIFESSVPLPSDPPRWMYVLCKPGSKDTPLVPSKNQYPDEPDWKSETDGLKFYDGNDEGINPKPPPDPCLEANETNGDETETCEDPESSLVPCEEEEEATEPSPEFRNRNVLMPEKFKIKLRPAEPEPDDGNEKPSLEKFIEKKTVAMKKSKPKQMKENILYDLQRICLNVPFDPKKINAPCRKPPPPECPQPPNFYRSFSTFNHSPIKNLYSDQLFKIQRRTDCGDSSEKCKPKELVPAPRKCPEKPKPKDCAEITLPCCSKARIPPSCMVKRPLPPCKKKLAPKPSFSECSKDPPPCPKMTECDCWEKKPGKPKKFSDWAALRGDPKLMTQVQEGDGKLGKDADKTENL